MRYYEFRYLVEGYPQAQAAFIQAGADTATVQKTIADFKQLVTRNQVKDVNQKNIDWWTKQGWDKFSQFVNQAAAIPSKSQVEKKKLPGQSINLVDNANWFIVIPLDKEASCFHGKNSDWCTTKVHHSYFEQYFYDKEITLIYCFNKSTGGMWAIAAHKNTDKFEMFDQQDNTLTTEQFQKQTGLDPAQLRAMALGDVHQPKVQASRDKMKESLALTKKLLYSMSEGTRSPEIEKQLLYNKSGKECLLYIQMVGSIASKDFPLAIQLAAIKADPLVMQFIKDPNEKVQLTAVNQHGSAIQYIKNPSEQVQMAAVNRTGTAIHYIENPSEQVQLAAVKKNESAIQYIENPSEQVQLAAVKNDGIIIQHIKNPSEQVQLAAIKAGVYAIEYIKNPTPKAKELADRMYIMGVEFWPDDY
jgi:DNA gyrase inhibitor GyrI